MTLTATRPLSQSDSRLRWVPAAAGWTVGVIATLSLIASVSPVIRWLIREPREFINDYVFNFDEMDRIPYMAPSLVSKEKAERGKTPTDVWWHTIVPTNGREKTGYPTQKPEGILRRMVQASTQPGDWCLRAQPKICRGPCGIKVLLSGQFESALRTCRYWQ